MDKRVKVKSKNDWMQRGVSAVPMAARVVSKKKEDKS